MSIESKESVNKSELLSLLYVVILALIIRTLIFEPFFVPTGSMKLTVLEGDYIFSTKYSYGYSNYSIPFNPDIFKGRILASAPERGDIVIFRPPMDMERRYIKRLIGLPGDKIQLINNLIYINDKPIHREEVGELKGENGEFYKKYKEILPNGVSYFSYKLDLEKNNILSENKYSNTEIFYVPSDKYFFLGDNRDGSNDSRIDLGFVPFQNFIAKGQFILFSTEEFFWLENTGITDIFSRIWPWLSSIRFHRLFKSIYAI